MAQTYSAINSKPWATSTKYRVGDVVMVGTYPVQCLTVHTSGTYATDVNNYYWQLLYAAKNWILNSDMKISQRGDFTTSSSATNLAYWIDRWRLSVGTSSNKQVLSSNQPPNLLGSNSARITHTATNSNVYVYHSQKIENYQYFANKTITVSCWIKAHNTSSLQSNLSIRVDYGLSAPAIAVPTAMVNDTWIQMAYTFTVGTTPTQLDIQIGSQNSAMSNGDYVEITNVMVNEGPAPAQFQLAGANYGGDLALCMRYFENIAFTAANDYMAGLLMSAQTSTSIWVAMPMISRKRIGNPTVTFNGVYNTDYTLLDLATYVALAPTTTTWTALTSDERTNYSAVGTFVLSGGTVATLGHQYMILVKPSLTTRPSFWVDAEL